MIQTHLTQVDGTLRTKGMFTVIMQTSVFADIYIYICVTAWPRSIFQAERICLFSIWTWTSFVYWKALCYGMLVMNMQYIGSMSLFNTKQIGCTVLSKHCYM